MMMMMMMMMMTMTVMMITGAADESAEVIRHGNSPVGIAIEGVSCAFCVGRVENAIRSVPGVASASVDLPTERADIALMASSTRSPLSLRNEQAGYEAAAKKRTCPDSAEPRHRARQSET